MCIHQLPIPFCRVPSASSPGLAFGSGINSRFSKSLADEISALSFIDAAGAATAASSNPTALDEAHLAAQEVGGGSTGNIAASAAPARSSSRSTSGLSLSLSSDESVCQMALKRKRLDIFIICFNFLKASSTF